MQQVTQQATTQLGTAGENQPRHRYRYKCHCGDSGLEK
jgi:predicted SprT family Zn-dependent metalloprotease